MACDINIARERLVEYLVSVRQLAFEVVDISGNVVSIFSCYSAGMVYGIIASVPMFDMIPHVCAKVWLTNISRLAWLEEH